MLYDAAPASTIGAADKSDRRNGTAPAATTSKNIAVSHRALVSWPESELDVCANAKNAATAKSGKAGQAFQPRTCTPAATMPSMNAGSAARSVLIARV